MSTNNLHVANKILTDLKEYYEFKTFQQLADYLGVDKSTISTWKARGSIGDIDLVLAKCKGINYEWLRTGTGDMFQAGAAPIDNHRPEGAFDVPPAKRSVPIINWAQAGTEGFFVDCYAVGDGIGSLPWLDELRDENAYALVIRGDSMSERYDPGDFVIVSPAAGVKSGDYAIVKLVDGQVMCKKVTARNGEFILSSVNKAYDDLFVAKQDILFMHKIVGSKPGG